MLGVATVIIWIVPYPTELISPFFLNGDEAVDPYILVGDTVSAHYDKFEMGIVLKGVVKRRAWYMDEESNRSLWLHIDLDLTSIKMLEQGKGK